MPKGYFLWILEHALKKKQLIKYFNGYFHPFTIPFSSSKEKLNTVCPIE